jgi:hypothetical protein
MQPRAAAATAAVVAVDAVMPLADFINYSPTALPSYVGCCYQG